VRSRVSPTLHVFRFGDKTLSERFLSLLDFLFEVQLIEMISFVDTVSIAIANASQTSPFEKISYLVTMRWFVISTFLSS